MPASTCTLGAVAQPMIVSVSSERIGVAVRIEVDDRGGQRHRAGAGHDREVHVDGLPKHMLPLFGVVMLLPGSPRSSVCEYATNAAFTCPRAP